VQTAARAYPHHLHPEISTTDHHGNGNTYGPVRRIENHVIFSTTCQMLYRRPTENPILIRNKQGLHRRCNRRVHLADSGSKSKATVGTDVPSLARTIFYLLDEICTMESCT